MALTLEGLARPLEDGPRRAEVLGRLLARHPQLAQLAALQPLVLVHGGGAQLTSMLERLGVPTRFHEGQRVTCEATLEVAEMVLAGKVNKELSGRLQALGLKAVGVCGSDGVRVNGNNKLACKMLMRDILPKKPGKELTLTIEPMRGLPVEKDLVVNMEPFMDAYKAIKPYLITSGNPPTRERIQSQHDRHRYDDTTKCILCGICTTSCPVYWSEGSYFGPAAIVNAHRFIFDSRDEGAAERLDILNEVDGVWRCRTTFNCTDACPRGIQVTQAIAEVKQAILRGQP